MIIVNCIIFASMLIRTLEANSPKMVRISVFDPILQTSLFDLERSRHLRMNVKRWGIPASQRTAPCPKTQRLTLSPQAWIPVRPTVHSLCFYQGLRCKHLKAFFKYVLCGIDVTVMFCSALRTCPSAYREVSDIMVYLSAAAAPLAGRV